MPGLMGSIISRIKTKKISSSAGISKEWRCPKIGINANANVLIANILIGIKKYTRSHCRYLPGQAPYGISCESENYGQALEQTPPLPPRMTPEEVKHAEATNGCPTALVLFNSHSNNCHGNEETGEIPKSCRIRFSVGKNLQVGEHQIPEHYYSPLPPNLQLECLSRSVC